MKKKRSVFPRIYGTFLAAAVTFILLDTFVIPKAQTAAAADTGASFVFETQAVSADETEDRAADETGDGYRVYAHGTGGMGTEESEEAAVSSGSTEEGEASAGSAEEDGGTSIEAEAADEPDAGLEPAAEGGWTYSDENISISILEETISDTQVYIADIRVSSAEYLKTAFAQDLFGRNIKETTSDIAESRDAVLAINGDYYGFRDYGYVIRNGILYRETAGDAEDLVIYPDGSFAIADETEVTARQLLDDGAWQVLSFGPALVEDGETSVGIGEEVDQAMTSNPRTAIGMISPLHYIIVVSDGRSDESEGLTLYELAEVLQEQGCEVAYNLDGGGSTTLWFMGEVINQPAGGRSSSSERKVSDIVYFGY